MRPILLAGHERPLTSLKFNADGDLFFTSAKDKGAICWRYSNGERLGTFDGHNGSIWNLDVSQDSQRLYTASADNSCKIWDVNTGKELYHWEHPTPCRQCALSTGDKFVANALYPRRGEGLPSTVKIFKLEDDVSQHSPTEVTTIGLDDKGHKHTGNIVGMLWSATNEHLLTCSDDCTIRKWDVETGKQVGIIDEDHTKKINDIQFSKCKTHFVTSSSDTTAKVFDMRRMSTAPPGRQALKTYRTSAPVNSACISPHKEHVLVVGGQEAADVTTTSTGAGKFEIRIFHKIFEEQLATVKGHFGPVNCVAYAPDGNGYVSGGEEGFIRVNHFDPDYFKLMS